MIGTGGASRGALQREWLEGLLDLMPSPLLLIEPGTARVLFANRAAHRMAGGEFPLGVEAERYHEVYYATDSRGRRIPDEQMPGVRAARGERLEGFQMDWRTPDGVRSLILQADTIPAMYGQPATVVVCFEEVSDLKRTEERVREQADEIARLYRRARDAERRKDESLALLDTLLANAPVGLGFLGPDLRYVRVNRAVAEASGVPASDHIGRTPAQVTAGIGEAIEERARRVMETREPLLDQDLAGEAAAAPGERRHWVTSHYPVLASEGEVLGVGVVIMDVTERRRLLDAEHAARRRAEQAEQRWAFLADAGDLLASSLDYHETLRRLTEIVVPEKADLCAVDMLQADGRVERLAVAHVDPERERIGWEVARRWPMSLDDPIGPGAVIRTGKPEEHPEVTEQTIAIFARDQEERDLLGTLGITSAVCVPLKLHGRTFGALTMVGEAGRRFHEDDLELAVELARRAAVAVENARLYAERSRIAHTLQHSLLPPHLPVIPGFEVAARYRPAGTGYDVGGDFYDLFETSKGCWSVVIGDVCGKGPDAAALTALARYTVRAAAIQERSPSRVLGLLNAAILREQGDERFCTAAYATLYESDGPSPAVIACGGHPLPLLARPSGEVEVVGEPGSLLGFDREPKLSDRTLVLAPGDALLLYTDGVADVAARTELLETADLKRILARSAGQDAEAIAGVLDAALVDRFGEGGGRDDAAFVVVRRTE